MSLRARLDVITARSSVPTWGVRSASCLVVGGLEYGLLAVAFDASHLRGVPLALLPSNLVAVASAALTAAVLLRGPALAEALRRASSRMGAPGVGWLFVHATLFLGFTLLGRQIFGTQTFDLRVWIAWLLLGVLTMLSLLRGVFGPSLADLAGPVARALLVGALPGAGAVYAVWWLRPLWPSLLTSTFPIAAALLTSVCPDAFVDAHTAVLGVRNFRAEVRPECSGVEGILVFGMLFAVYAFVCRKELRWPHVLVAFPLGGALVFGLNAVRIATLVAIGGFVSPAIAVGGFHSRAGWLSVCAVTVCVAHFAGRTPWLSARRNLAALDPAVGDATHSVAVNFCLPLCVLLATSMVTGLAAAGSVDWLYGLRIVTTGYAVWVGWRRELAERGNVLLRSLWGPGIPLGCALFGVWLLLADSPADGGASLSGALATAPAGLRYGWLALRTVGSVTVVPVAEELAFRGYLQRRLASRDFERVSFARPAPLAVLGSALAFGAAHQSIVAGGAAGVVFSLAASRRGHLGDAIAAHAVTNALIAVAVLAYDAWWLW